LPKVEKRTVGKSRAPASSVDLLEKKDFDRTKELVFFQVFEK
jgi:hypothetical protein